MEDLDVNRCICGSTNIRFYCSECTKGYCHRRCATNDLPRHRAHCESWEFEFAKAAVALPKGARAIYEKCEDPVSVSINGRIYNTLVDLPPEWAARRQANGLALERTVYHHNQDFVAGAVIRGAIHEINKREDDIKALQEQLVQENKNDEDQLDEETVECIHDVIFNHTRNIHKARKRDVLFDRQGDRRTYIVEFGRISQFDDGTVIFASSEPVVNSAPLYSETLKEHVKASINLVQPNVNDLSPWYDSCVITYDDNTFYTSQTIDGEFYKIKMKNHHIADAVRVGCSVYARLVDTKTKDIMLYRLCAGNFISITNLKDGGISNGTLHTDGTQVFMISGRSLLMLNAAWSRKCFFIVIRDDLPPHDSAAIVGARLYCARGRWIYDVEFADRTAQWCESEWSGDISHLAVVNGDLRVFIMINSDLTVYNAIRACICTHRGRGSINRVFVIGSRTFFQDVYHIQADLAVEVDFVKNNPIKCTVPLGAVVRSW